MDGLKSFNDALIDCVKALGGSKEVAPYLFPEKDTDVAQRQLLACLNETRPEKLCPDQAMLILKLAKEKGCHIGIEFLCAKLNYSKPNPIEPKDEMAELQRHFIESTKTLVEMAARIEHLRGAV